jgi:hypothetical protein
VHPQVPGALQYQDRQGEETTPIEMGLEHIFAVQSWYNNMEEDRLANPLRDVTNDQDSFGSRRPHAERPPHYLQDPEDMYDNAPPTNGREPTLMGGVGYDGGDEHEDVPSSQHVEWSDVDLYSVSPEHRRLVDCPRSPRPRHAFLFDPRGRNGKNADNEIVCTYQK